MRLDLHGMNCYQAQTAIDAALRRAGEKRYNRLGLCPKLGISYQFHVLFVNVDSY